ncbi:MAG: hypothetical protein PHG53_09455 [Phycisphaerae bacterium]|nr:hypothetical protein [Phycisphaerae bacterium]
MREAITAGFFVFFLLFTLFFMAGYVADYIRGNKAEMPTAAFVVFLFVLLTAIFFGLYNKH